MKKLGWWNELTPEEQKAAEGKNWKTDLSGGIQRVCMVNHNVPLLGQRQGARRGLELPRRRPAAPRAALQPAPGPRRQVPDPRRQEGLLAAAHALQDGAAEGGRRTRWRRSTRSCSPRDAWSSTRAAATRRAPIRGSPSCSRRTSSRSTPRTRPTAASSTGTGSGCSTPTGRADQGARAGHRARRRRARASSRSTSPAGGRARTCSTSIPEGAAPIVRGEAVNTATTYGYDSVTMMQETKTTLCNIERA